VGGWEMGKLVVSGSVLSLVVLIVVKSECTRTAERKGAKADCVAPPEWFPPSKITEDPTAKTDPGTDNCNFHKWACQEMLFLTDTVDKLPRFLGFPTDKDLLTPGRIPPEFGKRPKHAVTSLAPRVNKFSAPKPLDSIFQAQTQGMALVDQNARAVYYLIHVNEAYYNFVRNNKLYDPAGYQAFPKDKNFDEGCVSIKSAWQIVPKGGSATGLFTTTAEVALLEDDGGKVKISTGTRKETVALVGIHIVGRVKNHPEFIWATFEHNRNVPELKEGGDPDSPDPVSDDSFTFYKAKTPAKDCNHSNANVLQFADPKDIASQKLKPIVHVFRQFRQGGGNTENRNNIISLNRSVHEQLKKVDPKSVWLNYDLIGSVWTSGTLTPGHTIPITDTIGSVRLSNATMETTTQRQRNCFGCHDTSAPTLQGVGPEGKNIKRL
jgi:hypothetical protein